MIIYDFQDFRLFLKDYLKNQPKNGHGILSLWAGKLKVSTTLLSQILKGAKPLSLELAEALSKELELAAKELDYFMLLVQMDRAGTHTLKSYFKEKVIEAQKGAQLLKNRVKDVKTISEENRIRYYSSWIFAGVRNLAVCSSVKSAEDIAGRLGLPRPVVAETLEFLEATNLLVRKKSGWDSGVSSTYLSSDSPLVSKHHMNWRLKAMQKMEIPTTNNLFYTSPMSLSVDVAEKLRKVIVDFIESVHDQAGPSDSETARCLTIDWFQY